MEAALRKFTIAIAVICRSLRLAKIVGNVLYVGSGSMKQASLLGSVWHRAREVNQRHKAHLHKRMLAERKIAYASCAKRVSPAIISREKSERNRAVMSEEIRQTRAVMARRWHDLYICWPA